MTRVVLPLSLAMFAVTVLAVRAARTARADLRLARAALLDTHARLLATRAILARANDALQATDTFLARLDQEQGLVERPAPQPPKVH